jgi:hypothetical protein
MGFADLSFTPSEYILLNADRYAAEGSGKNEHSLLCRDGTVDGPNLAVILVMASILACRAEGALEIIVGQSKRLFRADTVSHVLLKPGGSVPNWNGYTLENTVLFVAGQLFAMQDVNTARNVTYEIVQKDCEKPWEKIIEVVEWGLASSNWLIPVEGEAAAAFSTPFICPAKVRDLAIAQPEEPVKGLLTDCKHHQPELWKALYNEISLALKDRRL